MHPVGDANYIRAKRKAVTAFFPYAVWNERRGDRTMIDLFLAAARASNPLWRLIDWDEFMWKAIRAFVDTLFDEASPDSLNRVLMLVSPYVPLETWCLNEKMVTRWAAATLTGPRRMELEVVRSVVAVLLRIASIDFLQPHIPTSTWVYLKKLPSLPPGRSGRTLETSGPVVRIIRTLGDVEILKSYLLLVWSDWYPPWGFDAMCVSIQRDFRGIGMGRHRADLIKQLDCVLGQLDQGLGYLRLRSPGIDGRSVEFSKDRYNEFKRLLLGLEEGTLRILTGAPFNLFDHLDFLTTADVHRVPLNICLRAPSPVSVVVCPRCSPLDPPTPWSDSAWISQRHFSITQPFGSACAPLTIPKPPSQLCDLDERRTIRG